MALTILVYSLWSFLKKVWIVLTGKIRKAELKKKKRTRKDTENVEALGMSMEMTLSITNKLVETLFHEKSASFICLVVFEV